MCTVTCSTYMYAMSLPVGSYHLYQCIHLVWLCSNADTLSFSGESKARPPGIPVREFPGIADAKIPGENSREFLKFWRELRGISRVLSFFPIIIDILVFNLTAFWAKSWMTYLTQLFNCVYRVPVYFQILISKNHWTASEFRKLRSLHEWGRWDNSNRSYGEGFAYNGPGI